MRKIPSSTVAYDRAWRSIEHSERAHAPKLFAHIEDLVDCGHTDIEIVAAHAVGMLRRQRSLPTQQRRPKLVFPLAWLRPPGIRPYAGTHIP